MRRNDASKALDDVHGLAAQVCQTHACARMPSLNQIEEPMQQQWLDCNLAHARRTLLVWVAHRDAAGIFK